MNAKSGLDKCLTFINCEIQPFAIPSRTARSPVATKWRAVTLSRQTGSGGHVIADELSKLVEGRLGSGGRPWTVFDRNLVEQVLEDHHLPKRLAQFMPEDKVSEMTDSLEELLGLHPPSYTLVRQASETILRLVDLGNVIIIGRGANIVTAKTPGVFHVRLVAPLESRIDYMIRTQHISRQVAQETISKEDRGRERYVKKHFDADIRDPLLYHMVLNTDKVAPSDAARLIAATLLRDEKM